MHEKYKVLLEILLDKNYPDLGTRDDIAMDLRESNEPEVLTALIKVASDPNEEYIIAASAGESIGAIMTRSNKIDVYALRKLVPSAQSEALAVISAKAPDLFKKYNLKDLNEKNRSKE